VRYFLSTGEASGERSAVLLAAALRERDSQAHFEGIGGQAMRDAGIALWRDHRGWASMGLFAAIPKIPWLLGEMWLTAIHIARERPDLVVLVDFGAFNVRLVKTLRSRLRFKGPIVYLYPPAAWLDRENVARIVSRYTLPITAFEHQASFYRSLALPIYYFGHPLLSQYRMREPRPAPPSDGGTIALLPGSRMMEIKHHVPVLLRAFDELRKKRPRLKGTVAAVDDKMRRVLQRRIGALQRDDLRIEIGVRAAVEDVDAAWVASGTAVLESVLLGVPAIAVYVVSRAVAGYGRKMQRLIYGGRFITLPNLVMGEELVPEYLQDEATPQHLADAMERLLRDPQRTRDRFEALRTALGDHAALERIADFAFALAKNGSVSDR
jgi:lipid-A-disaccharide synthase